MKLLKLFIIFCLSTLTTSSFAIEPEEGWGPHYLSCFQHYYRDTNFYQLNISEIDMSLPIYSENFTKLDSNGLQAWTKKISFWRLKCEHNSNYSALMFKVDILSQGEGVGSPETRNFETYFSQGDITTFPESYSKCANISKCSGYSDIAATRVGKGIYLIPYMRNTKFNMSDSFIVRIENTNESLLVDAEDKHDINMDKNLMCQKALNPTIDENLNICIPSILFNLKGINRKLWGRFEYVGKQNGEDLWRLVNHGDK